MKKSQAGGGVAVKIEHAVYETAKMVGRHFDENDEMLSMISRESIDVLKVCVLSPVRANEVHQVIILYPRLHSETTCRRTNGC